MEKIDARALKDEALYERRRQVIRLHKRGGNPTQIAQVSELSYPSVRKTFDSMKQAARLE